MDGDPAQRSPDYGPGGYLPPRASQRARKIVLREQMGLQWVIAAVVAAVAVAAGGAAYLFLAATPPGAPYVAVSPIDDVDPSDAEVLAFPPADYDVLVVRAGGGVRVFEAPAGAARYCPVSRRLEAPPDAVWNLNGRRTGGSVDSLRPLAAEVFDGRLYVDPTQRLPVPDAAGDDESPAC